MVKSNSLAGKRVLVVGVGTRGGGEGAARYLAAAGADVHLTDGAPRSQLAPVLERLSELDRISLDLLDHPQDSIDPAGFDLVVRNPAVPNEATILERARTSNIPIETETSLFLARFPGSVVSITGSKGKTSTAYYLAHLLGMAEGCDVRLVGNLGGPSLDSLRGATANSTAVIELSSFQIETVSESSISTGISCLTNLQGDHQDRYPTYEAYWNAKRGLFANQRPSEWRVHATVLEPSGYFDGLQSSWFSVLADAPGAAAAIWLNRGVVVLRTDGVVAQVVDRTSVPVVDEHRFENALIAMAAASLSGITIDEISRRALSLPEVPHRMETVLESSGRLWLNDTAASTPTAAACGLRSRGKTDQVCVILGGSSKGLTLEPLIRAVEDVQPTVILLPGEESLRIRQAMSALSVDAPISAASMDEAVDLAFRRSERCVLLSPGCASFAKDGFPGFADEFERGGLFAAEVLRLHGLEVDDDLRAVLCSPRRAAICDLASVPRNSEHGAGR